MSSPSSSAPSSVPVSPLGLLVVVDASNLARALGGSARLGFVTAVSRFLTDLRHDIRFVADASLRHLIDKKADYEVLVRQFCIVQAPPKARADDFIGLLATEYAGRGRQIVVVSNDTFVDRLGVAEVRRAGFMVVPERDGWMLILGAPFDAVLGVNASVEASATKWGDLGRHRASTLIADNGTNGLPNLVGE